MSHVLGLALVCAALVTASASCVPAIHAVLTQLRDRGLRDWFYVDADGHGTPETITRFSNRRNKVVIGAFSALGLAASVIEFILEVVGQADFRQKLEAGLYTITWVSGSSSLLHRRS